tara:strand:+ start:37 stop:414 length:378 start_codon:yes stop_codon:yes gene_type:complete
MASYDYTPGLGNVGAYQVSGKPFVSGSIACKGPNAEKLITFPSVTSFISITNGDQNDDDLKIAFSRYGLIGTNYYTVMAGSATVFPVKCTELWVTGSTDVSIIAGLTGIPRASIPDNFSGSTGVG